MQGLRHIASHAYVVSSGSLCRTCGSRASGAWPSWRARAPTSGSPRWTALFCAYLFLAFPFGAAQGSYEWFTQVGSATLAALPPVVTVANLALPCLR